MKRLFDKVLATNKFTWGELSAPIESAQVFVADDVWTAIDDSPKERYTADDFSNLSPVYPLFWIEAKSIYSRVVGACLFEEISSVLPVNESAYGLPDDKEISQIRWAYRIYGVMSTGSHISRFPGCAYIHVGENGELLNDTKRIVFRTSKGLEHILAEPNLAYAYNFLPLKDFALMFPMALTTISLLHSNRIEVTDNMPRASESKKWHKKTGRALTIYKTLKVKPVKPLSESEGVSIRDYLRFHHVRGHWKTYTEDAPLFGKYVGRIYVPAHRSWKLSQKIIMPNGVSYDPKWGFTENYHQSDFFNDLDKALCFLTGDKVTEILTIQKAILERLRLVNGARWGQSDADFKDLFESHFFNIKIHKKGTVHLIFKDADLLARFNQAAAQGKGWLGDGS